MELGWTLPACPHALFIVELVWARQGSSVTHRYLLSTDGQHPLAPLLELPAAKLTVSHGGPGRVRAENAGSIAAIDVRLVDSSPSRAILAGENNIILLPGESYEFTYRPMPLEPGAGHAGGLELEWFNADEPIRLE